jgi:hypothetical protein
MASRKDSNFPTQIDPKSYAKSYETTPRKGYHRSDHQNHHNHHHHHHTNRHSHRHRRHSVASPFECSALEGSDPLQKALKIHLEKTSFMTDEPVVGKVLLELACPMEISGIYVQVEGLERAKFRQKAGNFNGELHAEDLHLKADATISSVIPTRLPISQPHFLQNTLFTFISSVTRHHGVLLPSTHSFPFSFLLPPKNLPSSLLFVSGNKYHAEVTYDATVLVFRPNKPALTLTCPLALKASPAGVPDSLTPFIDRTLLAHRMLCCWLASEVTLSASWKENVFGAGDSVPISLVVSSKSFSSIKTAKVKLVQQLVLDINGSQFTHFEPICKAKFAGLEGQKLSPGSELTGMTTIAIPAHPETVIPTTNTSAIHFRYFLAFEIGLRWHQNIHCSSELTIK